jgi:hypothetical protein
MAARTASAAATTIITGDGSCNSSACHAPLQQRSWSPELPGDQQQPDQQLEGGPPAEPYPAAHSILQLAALHRAAGDASAGVVDAAKQPNQAAAAAAADGAGGAHGGGRSHHHRVRFKGGTSVASSAAGTSASLIPVGFCQQQQHQSTTDLALQLSSQQLPAIAAPPAAPAATALPGPILPGCVLRASAMAFGSIADSSSSHGAHRRQAPGPEAQTWLILELCDGGTLLDLLDEGCIGAPSKGKNDMRRLVSRAGKPQSLGARQASCKGGAGGAADGEGLSPPHGTRGLVIHSRLPCAVLRQANVLTLLLDVARGMSYLHSRNVLHVSEGE